MQTIGNQVEDSSNCSAYGTKTDGTPFPVCPFCSTIPLDTHDEYTCYMKGDDDSYGNDGQDYCNWKCLRCEGSSEKDCIACMPNINLDL